MTKIMLRWLRMEVNHLDLMSTKARKNVVLQVTLELL